MYHWFNPAHVGFCSLNVGLVTSAIILMVVLTCVSLHPAAKQVRRTPVPAPGPHTIFGGRPPACALSMPSVVQA